jgi:hypothetical protein
VDVIDDNPNENISLGTAGWTWTTVSNLAHVPMKRQECCQIKVKEIVTRSKFIPYQFVH